jgi:hypothetical protein
VSQQRQGRFRRLLSKLTTSDAELEAQELQQDAVESGSTPIGRCGDREKVTVTGTLRTVTLRPRAGVPALEAELYDGSGTLSVVWLGRRRIGGVEPGRVLTASGRVSWAEGHPVMFNPRYELRAATGS